MIIICSFLTDCSIELRTVNLTELNINSYNISSIKSINGSLRIRELFIKNIS